MLLLSYFQNEITGLVVVSNALLSFFYMPSNR